jgi:hypothetical protein
MHGAGWSSGDDSDDDGFDDALDTKQVSGARVSTALII